MRYITVAAVAAITALTAGAGLAACSSSTSSGSASGSGATASASASTASCTYSGVQGELYAKGTLTVATDKPATLTLVAERLDATLVNMRFVKPLDDALIISLAARHRAMITIEENSIMGGAGSAVGEVLVAADVQIPMLQLGIPDRFIEHGSRATCLAAAGLDLASLSARVDHWWAPLAQERVRSVRGV